ncbi:MAG: RlmE family RNA methyltransferase [Pseudomonadales bacterium]|nr:RlmE family RNA methyltransferase [Pseudomonadales bacterium]MBO6597455.1 RlmE family RNA methyltransferase [Pseudomonadales bacterium]MBO6824189.1 RlmE family RNA methyltransferase [Pseudomonadales bacterium]
MKKSKSSARWLNDHENDEYVQRARREGFRSRAVYKLLEIQEKYQILKPGSVVVDLGAAPGGWMQVARKTVGDSGFVVGLDLLAIEPLADCTFIQGDFTEDAVLRQLMDALEERQVDLVISDMAPNLSGMKDIDQPRSMYLVELAVHFAAEVLRPGGSFLAKCFEGEGIDGLRATIRNEFKQLSNVKPKASRVKSREIYLLGRSFKGSLA